VRLNRKIRKNPKELVVPEKLCIFAAQRVVFDIVILET
jgi:hypothetical protein